MQRMERMVDWVFEAKHPIAKVVFGVVALAWFLVTLQATLVVVGCFVLGSLGCGPLPLPWLAWLLVSWIWLGLNFDEFRW